MPKLKIYQDKQPKKEEATQEEIPNIKEKENQQKGVLPEDIDFRRGMGCG